MTHRIDIEEDGGRTRIGFEGALDAKGLEAIIAGVREARRRGVHRITLTLRSGTEVSRECIEPLRMIEGLTIEAESQYLARWIRQKTAD